VGSKLKLPLVCGISTPHFGSGSAAAKAGAAIKMMGKALITLIAAIMGAASAWLISNLYLAVVHLLRDHVKSRIKPYSGRRLQDFAKSSTEFLGLRAHFSVKPSEVAKLVASVARSLPIGR